IAEKTGKTAENTGRITAKTEEITGKIAEEIVTSEINLIPDAAAVAAAAVCTAVSFPKNTGIINTETMIVNSWMVC
ncbi:MAG TPA: hypothetical protein VHQ70_03010, partial [Syntrophomonadaceae bacterium]|nr:hypothetical protein [Syntrophomonadaceae bacterium]